MSVAARLAAFISSSSGSWPSTTGDTVLDLEEVGADDDDGQQIVEVVGDAAGQLADGFQPLGLTQLRFEILLAGAIDEKPARLHSSPASSNSPTASARTVTMRPSRRRERQLAARPAGHRRAAVAEQASRACGIDEEGRDWVWRALRRCDSNPSSEANA